MGRQYSPGKLIIRIVSYPLLKIKAQENKTQGLLPEKMVDLSFNGGLIVGTKLRPIRI